MRLHRRLYGEIRPVAVFPTGSNPQIFTKSLCVGI